MWLLKLAWKNLWRNKSRTAVTISSIFFAVILSVTTSSLQDGVFDHFVKNMVGFYTGYIQIHQQGYWDQQILDNSFEQNPSLVKKIKSIEGVTHMAPRLESYALASANELTKGCMVIGIAPSEEDNITQLKQKITIGEYLKDDEQEPVALVAEGLAKRLKLELNDTIILISQGYHGFMAAGKYKITGLLHFGSPDLNDQLLYLPLATAQTLYSADALLTSYVLAIDNSENLETLSTDVTKLCGPAYEVMTWKEMLPEVEQHIKTDKGSMYIIQGILYLLICFGIFGTLLMMMAERRYEMGMLIAIGMKKSKLMLIMLAESVLTVVIGCIAGMAASFPIVWYLKYYPIRFRGEFAEAYARFGFEPIFPASINAQIFITQGIIVLILGFILSLYPIVKIVRLNPVTAMKK